ncbi:hypothetical protein E3T54_02820 [Cryobacterium sp. Sr8]|uniref:lambda exonuclease family protein n=1 Tax=Cryobacterium sp. Sr8 TaxID=1259203 RepID=UPI00106D5003|nr:lambda exonuclease family protein [Cryobacterium sp. Sr8]TFD80691.1 hypothetical protein E3T54_02820 [Cryobacterium sp. Sr8]
MTLHIYNELEQGSPEWLAARCGLVTASVVGKLITPTLKVADNDTSRGVIETLVAQRISHFVEDVFPNADMQRGTDDEPYARDLYSRDYAPVEQVGFATREFGAHKLGASPDGLVGDDGGIEIKSRKAKVHLRTILTDTVPAENHAQIQSCLLVFGREWWDYVSYAGGWPLHVIRVYPNEAWQTAIRDALDKFEENAARMIDAYNAATNGAPIAPRIDHFAEMSF